jgi:hypothetical protein
MIGKMPTTFNNGPNDISGLSGLFLNTEYRSPCNGNVTAWDFCYYISATPMSNITIQAGVWRESGGSYTLVNDSLINLPIPDPEEGFLFVYRHWVLDKSQFKVEVGDVVGMYVNDTSDNSTVHILGMHPNGGIVKSMQTLTDINNVSNSILMPTDYSLYLVALLGIVTMVHAILLYNNHCQCSVIQLVIGTAQSNARPLRIPPHPLRILPPPPQPLCQLCLTLIITSLKCGKSS